MVEQNASLRSVYTPLALFLLGALGICLWASNVAEGKAAAALVPDVVKTYHNCEYLGKDHVMVSGGSVWSYLSTSCGRFDDTLQRLELEKGQSYDIQTTRSTAKGSYISKISPPS